MKETRLKYYSPAAAGHQHIIRELWKLIFSLPAIESFQLLQKGRNLFESAKLTQLKIFFLYFIQICSEVLELYVAFHVNLVSLLLADRK